MNIMLTLTLLVGGDYCKVLVMTYSQKSGQTSNLILGCVIVKLAESIQETFGIHWPNG